MKDRKITFPIRISVKKNSCKIDNSKFLFFFNFSFTIPLKKNFKKICVYNGEKNKSNESLKLSLYYM